MSIEQSVETKVNKKPFIEFTPLRTEEKTILNYSALATTFTGLFFGIIGNSPELGFRIAIITATLWGIETFIDRVHRK